MVTLQIKTQKGSGSNQRDDQMSDGQNLSINKLQQDNDYQELTPLLLQ